jgi:hypothetical protein
MWVATGAPHYYPCPSINAGRMKSTGKEKKDGETERRRDGEIEAQRSFRESDARRCVSSVVVYELAVQAKAKAKA